MRADDLESRTDWKTIQGEYDPFANEPILSTSAMGAEMKLDFKGTAIGLYISPAPMPELWSTRLMTSPFRLRPLPSLQQRPSLPSDGDS